MSELLQSPAVLIRAILQNANLISIPQDGLSWPCYISAMPDGDLVKDECVTAYDQGGEMQGREMRAGQFFERFAVQIKVRAKNYQTGWNQLSQMIQCLDGVNRLGIDAVNYIYDIPAVGRGPAISMGPEQGTKRRFHFSVNLNFSCKEYATPFLNLGDDFYTQGGRFHTLINVTLPPLLVIN